MIDTTVDRLKVLSGKSPCREWVRLSIIISTSIKLKINSKDNTIIIKKIKDSWTREEVIKSLQKFACDVFNENYGKDTSFKEKCELMFNKWIEQNL